MSDIAGYYEKIQSEETEFKTAVSEILLEKIGATINKALDDVISLPVGSIQASMLTVEQFATVMGPHWYLCNGQSASGTAYRSTYGFTNVPDLRGKFTRCKDNGRSLNPDGDLALGASQTNMLQTHNHNRTLALTTASNMAPTKIMDNGPNRNICLGNNLSNILTIEILNTGGAENRPECVTVNYFIKVD